MNYISDPHPRVRFACYEAIGQTKRNLNKISDKLLLYEQVFEVGSPWLNFQTGKLDSCMS